MVKVGPGLTVSLGRLWRVGEKLNSGGFGEIYEVECDGESGFVAKFVPEDPGAERELLLGDLPTSRFVVPVIDKGVWDGYVVLVMPRAEKSLRDALDQGGGRIHVDKALAVLVDVASGLADIGGEVVHRDLKPSNVLLLDGRWQIADFGIARYADATTAPDTHKFSMTPPYAAPEQWRNERATSATDVYAFGVMAFEVLSGALPFPGPSASEFRDQHLQTAAPVLSGVPTPIGSLVAECLTKAPGARPTAATVVERLKKQQENRPRVGALAAAHDHAVRIKAEAARRQSLQQTEDERLTELRAAGVRSLAGVSQVLVETIRDQAPAASVRLDADGTGFRAALNDAVLRFSSPRKALPAADIPFEVVLEASIGLTAPLKYDWDGREHSIWFCDAQVAGAFRWFEAAFAMGPVVGGRARQTPFALASEDASQPLLRLGKFAVAWPFTPIDQGEEAEFVERWLTWFGEASLGKLTMPTRMPEFPVQGSWRKGSGKG